MLAEVNIGLLTNLTSHHFYKENGKFAFSINSQNRIQLVNARIGLETKENTQNMNMK